MSRITTVKDKIPKKASWPGFLASGKDSRTKVVLARKIGKQGLGGTPGVHCPAHSLLLYIRLYRAFPWWIKISMYPWFFSTWEGQPSLSRSHKSSSSTCANFPQCPTHFFGSHFIPSIRIISIDFALKGEPVPGTVYQYLYLENKYRI